MISDTIDLESLLGQYDSETILVGPLLSLSMSSSYRYFFVAGKGAKIYNCFGLGFIDNESDAQKQRAGTIEKLKSRFADVVTCDSHAEMAHTVHARWQCEETARVLSSATIATEADPSKFGGNHAATKGSEERPPGNQRNKCILDALAQGLSPPAHSPALTTSDVSPTEQQRNFKLGPDDVTGKPAPTKATAEAPTGANLGVNPLASTAPTSKTELTNVDVREPINGLSYGLRSSGGHDQIVSVLSRGLLDQTRTDKQRPIELPPATGLLPRLTDRENDSGARHPNRDSGLTQDDFAAAILSLKSASRSDSLPILSSEPKTSLAAGIAILPPEPKPSQADIVTLPPVEGTTGFPSKSLRLAILVPVIILAWTLVPPSAQHGVEEPAPGSTIPPPVILNNGGENRQSAAAVRPSSSSKFVDPSVPRMFGSAGSSSAVLALEVEGTGASVAPASGKRAPTAAPVLANSSLAEQPSEVENTKVTTPTSSDRDASSGIASSPAAHGPQPETARTAIAALASDQQGPGTVPTTVASLPAARPSQIESTKIPVGPVSGQPTPAMAAFSAVASPPAAQLSEVKSNGAKVAPASGQLAPAAQQVGAATRLETDEIAKLVDRGMQSLKTGDLESARLSLRHAAEAISGPLAAPPISSERAANAASAENLHDAEMARPDQSAAVSETSPQPAPTPAIATVSKPSPPPQVATLNTGSAPVTKLTTSAPRDSTPRQLDSAEIARLLQRGTDFLENGDIASARLLLRRPAEAGNAEAALALGSAYDPLVLQQLGVVGVAPDVALARQWYQKAADLGSGDARQRLTNLAQTGQ